jgi:hypothetical protein
MRKSSVVRISLFGVLLALVGVSAVSVAFSQGQEGSNETQVVQEGQRPKFKTLPPRYLDNLLLAPASATVTHWSSSFTSGGVTYPFTMVGTNPATTDTTTTINVYIIPIKMVCRGRTYDPETVLANGHTPVTSTRSSPIFNSGITFDQGGTDVGDTQYIDAFQRANFWGDVKTHTGYHVLLNPIVEAQKTLSVPNHDCSNGNPFGFGTVGIVNINYFDAQLQTIIADNSQITPASFAIALTYNSYLSDTSNLAGCCIGGYHSDFGTSTAPQTYGHFTYIPVSGQFSQDVSALSHEVGAWVDDPFVNNGTPCGTLLEVGDPLVSSPHFGDYAYTLNGFTYHLQDLVFLDYFSGNSTIPVNHWFSFQHNKTGGQCS